MLVFGGLKQPGKGICNLLAVAVKPGFRDQSTKPNAGQVDLAGVKVVLGTKLPIDHVLIILP